MKYWAVVPAAGVGARMQADRPKQYLTLAGRTVLEHTLTRLAAHPRIAGLAVAIAPDDSWWPALQPNLSKPLYVAIGGAERCHSVLHALQALAGQADPGDWVLVHDAARPCLRGTDLDRLMTALSGHPVGGLLGLPVTDTVKRCDPQGQVLETVDRGGLWRALTPQMFRLDALQAALQSALARSWTVTDEASAMELTGARPQMVQGAADNIKITHPDDLVRAERILREQQESI